MRKILKYLLTIGLLVSQAFSVDKEEIKDAVLIVGSNRTKGWVIETIADIVNQNGADFSYKGKFTGRRVVSVDIQPCATNQEHIQGNFVTTKKFALNSQKTVLFEWFPPSEDTLANNPMILALKKAYDVLKPGGTIIIDNHPFFAILPKDSELEKFIVNLQKMNPFSLILTASARQKMYDFLISNAATNQTEALKESLKFTSKILGTTEEETRKTVAYFLSTKEDNEFLERLKVPTTYMFLWAYHSLSRNAYMVEALKQIGFNTTKSKVELMEHNPHNGRKWAWIIEATKPE